MQVAGFDWTEVRVSGLAVTVDGRDGQVALHSTDPDFALRLAEALVAAHGRRTLPAGETTGVGKSAIIRHPVRYPDAWDCAIEAGDQRQGDGDV